MELGLLGLFLLIGLAMLFEGYRLKNPFMIYTGAIFLMVTGTSLLTGGLNYPNGAIVNETLTGETVVTYTYAQKTDWYINTIGTLLFSLGFFGMFFYVTDYLSKKKGEVG